MRNLKFFKAVLGLLFIVVTVTASSQTYKQFRFELLDANGNAWNKQVEVQIRNTDSNSTNAFNTYSTIQASSSFTTGYFFVPQTYTSNLVTFSFDACGVRNYFDTTFTVQDSLSVVYQLPCYDMTCDAEFSYNVDQNANLDLTASGATWFLDHRWKIDGNPLGIDYWKVSTVLNSPGSHTITHIVENTHSSCIDSVSKTVSLDSNCHTTLTAATKPALQVDFTITGNAQRNGYITFGDGSHEQFVFSNSGTYSTSHTYQYSGNYTTVSYVEGIGCSDSAVEIASAVGGCNALFNPVAIQPFQFSLVRLDSSQGTVDWTITGNGTTQNLSGNGAVVTLPSAGTYLIKSEIKMGGSLACDHQQNLVINRCGTTASPLYVNGNMFVGSPYQYDFDSALVYHIAYDTSTATLVGLDSMVVHGQDSGAFYFAICNPNVIHLYKAALFPGTKYYSSYLPTYSDSSVLWSGAKPYGLNYGYVPIYLKAGTNTGGPGFIGGYISQGANKKGDALDGIQVLLLKQDGTPIASTVSFNGGRYEFNNLAYGDYKVLVEIPGKPSAEYLVSLNADNEEVDDLDFEVNEKDISTTTTGVQRLIAHALKVYPNPAQQILTISSKDESAVTVKGITDAQGRAVSQWSQSTSESAIHLDIASMPNGIYFIQVETSGTMGFVKFIKQ